MKKVFLQLGIVLALSSGMVATSCSNKPNDSKIASDFGDQAKLNPQLLNVNATANAGVLTLTGQCPDEACRASAEQAARQVKGVKSVVNNIVVSPTTAPVVIADDGILKNNVDDVMKKYNDVSADVQNGEVTLRGTIKRDDLQKLMMDLNALNPKKVNNQLTIK